MARWSAELVGVAVAAVAAIAGCHAPAKTGAMASSPDTIRARGSSGCVAARDSLERFIQANAPRLSELERLVVAFPRVAYLGVQSTGQLTYVVSPPIDGQYERKSSVLDDRSAHTVDSVWMAASGGSVDDLKSMGKLVQSLGMTCFQHMEHPEIAHLRRFIFFFRENGSSADRFGVGGYGSGCELWLMKYYLDTTAYDPWPASNDSVRGWGVQLKAVRE